MNKEVGFVMQGFGLTVVVFTGMLLGHHLATIPVKPALTQQTTAPVESTTQTSSTVNSNGAMLFKNNCGYCHSVVKNLTGPALAGVTERITDRELIYKWVHNPAAVLKEGNPYFLRLKKEYNDLVMTAFPNLTQNDIDDILAYIAERGERKQY